MAARDAEVTLTADAWTQITNGAATGDVSLALISGGPVKIQATASAVAPDSDDTSGMPLISYGDGWSEATIAEKFTGVSGAQHIYGRPERPGVAAVVYISHA